MPYAWNYKSIGSVTGELHKCNDVNITLWRHKVALGNIRLKFKANGDTFNSHHGRSLLCNKSEYITQKSILSAYHLSCQFSHYKEFSLKTRKNETVVDCNKFTANFSHPNQWEKLLHQGNPWDINWHWLYLEKKYVET